MSPHRPSLMTDNPLRNITTFPFPGCLPTCPPSLSRSLPLINFQTNLFMVHLLLSAAVTSRMASPPPPSPPPPPLLLLLLLGLHFDFENGLELFISLLLPLYICSEEIGTSAALFISTRRRPFCTPSGLDLPHGRRCGDERDVGGATSTLD